MTPEERAETEARADRSLRRGELAQALAGYDAIRRAFPDDAGVRRKLDELKESVDPVELRHPKANFAEPAPAASKPQTPEQEGERLFAQGDYPGAIAAYRRALALRPDAELLKERLGELFRLVQAPRQAPSAPAGALPAQSPASTPDADGLYRALLERIGSRRRP